MRILVLGGTVFLGRAVARLARAAGHDVTCAARGVSGRPVDGVRLVVVDRDDPAGLSSLDGERFDAVVDVTRRPSHARHAVDALADRVGHWTYVSTISVYADQATPGGTPASTPLLAPAPPEVDDPSGPNGHWYGACKVACELAVRDRIAADRLFICRAGLLIGPEDPSDRFPYWVARLAAGGEVLAPGAPDEPVQLVHVADLAGWLLHAAGTGLAGCFDGIGPVTTRAEVLAAIAAGVGQPQPRLTWVDGDFLREHDVRPWSGERALPLWLEPGYEGMLARDVGAALAAGLTPRPVAEAAADTRRWMLAEPAAVARGGLDRASEARVLRDWHHRGR
ncbi:NAD-dependent epimerase/dehydratase family protein [Solwaraspora sp. WMMD1047]|uniref:NAD-dependent epimerase/dehydratase family protein n=1 Tax=Solwaraspora sp. WMMD1047 TaxID=3016102 RepID=UPI0024171402|nr:NAD-dependent epimerase/dehydratase family protein [Solwaraspora sp. WMMD1047]MDG4828927.1 NAD-dependent epimerase/dehydratase family protein [Solwaraspora sp. WMMD1047]